jgi:4a-hydroxytetrahydrobiopterin dehydratase
MVQKLSPEQRSDFISKASAQGWSEVSGRDAITKSFLFQDFNQAFAFMTRVGLKAEKLDHHPEWFNVTTLINISPQHMLIFRPMRRFIIESRSHGLLTIVAVCLKGIW